MPFKIIYLSGDKDKNATILSHSQYISTLELETAQVAEKYIVEVKNFCERNKITPLPRYRIQKIVTAAWEEREAKRMQDGTYKPLPDFITDAYWWQNNKQIHGKHFAHLADKDESKIAFTESPEKGEADIQLVLSPTAYLSRYFGQVLGQRDIRDIGSMFQTGSFELKTSFSPDDFERIYEAAQNVCGDGSSAESCMRYPRRNFETPRHPSYAYGAGDLAIAWVDNEDGVYGRAVIWPEKKTYVRVYGNNANYQALMHRLLRAQGYVHVKEFEGARLLKYALPEIKHDNGMYYLAPYLDNRGTRYLREEGDFFVMTSDSEGTIYCDTTCGKMFVYKTVTCAKLGIQVRADDTVTVDGEIWSNRARRQYSGGISYCDHTNEFTTQPVVRVWGRHGRMSVKKSIADTWDTFYCERAEILCDVRYHNPMTVHTRNGTKVWSNKYREYVRKSRVDGKFYVTGYYPEKQQAPTPSAPASDETAIDSVYYGTITGRFRPSTQTFRFRADDLNWQLNVSDQIEFLQRTPLNWFEETSEVES